MTFSSFSFDRRIEAGIQAAGYTTPTPIQRQAIPAVLAGKDVLGLAQTGTGKTAAFALPLLQRLLNSGAGRTGPAQLLILAPTRELALQIHDSFRELGKKTGLRCAAVYGGVNQAPQVRALSQAAIVVACPGRLLDLLNQGLVNLSRVQSLVLDEADRMFDMGFLPDLRKIFSRLPGKRQNLLFSATMPSDIRGLADELLNDPAVIQVANNVPVESVTHALYPVEQHLKTNFLHALLKTTPHESVLVFTRTKHKAKSLADMLSRNGWMATSLQGNLSQNKRQEALSGFRIGKYRIMVATDIAARGIDCDCISHVINFDMPDTVESYTHRIGRTGRAQRSGAAISLVTYADQQQIKAIERILGHKLDRMELTGFDYRAPKRSYEERKPFRNQADSSRPGNRPSDKPHGRKPGKSFQKRGKNGFGDRQGAAAAA